MPIPAGMKPYMALLSSEDIGVLMEDAALHSYKESEALEDWFNSPLDEDALSLPFTRASAA